MAHYAAGSWSVLIVLAGATILNCVLAPLNKYLNLMVNLKPFMSNVLIFGGLCFYHLLRIKMMTCCVGIV